MRIIIILFAISIFTFQLFAELAPDSKKDQNELQRESKGVKDLQRNTRSDVEFLTSNIGIWGYDWARSKGGCFWPRESQNQYIFSAAVWFGCRKEFGGDFKKQVQLTYNTINGQSVMVPGRIEDGDTIFEDKEKDYRVYFSSDMMKNGQVFDPGDGPDWPLWFAGNNDPEGSFIHKTDKRNNENFPKGPAMLSDEDIFCTYKDTDSSSYDNEASDLEEPLGIQVEQTIYTWETTYKKDLLVISYKMINMSDDTLWNCWLSKIVDFDIALTTNSQSGAGNDRVDFYVEDKELELAVAWSNPERGESGKGFGYLGLSMLTTPALDAQGFLRHDKIRYDKEEQLGLITFRSWSIGSDPVTSDEKYNYMSSMIIDRDDGPDDKRTLFSTGPFNLVPGDTANMSFLVALALPSVNEDPDGTKEDMEDLVNIVRLMRQYYFDEFVYLDVAEEAVIIEEGNPLHLYPNPAGQYVNLSFKTGSQGRFLVEIYDISGRPVYKTNHMSFSSDNMLKVKTGGFPEGSYLVRVTGDKCALSSKFAVKR